jgi:hypothetical protein
VQCRRIAALLLFCMRIPCSIHSLLAVAALLLCRALVCTCMASLSSRCDVHDRRSVTALSSGMTASPSCGLSGCVVWGSLAYGVVRELASSVLTGFHFT